MEPRARYTVVGATVILLVSAAIAFGIWLADIGNEDRTELFAILFKEYSLSGLQVDSTVTMRGIKVGRVAGLQISENIELVRVVIEIDGQTPIKTDTQAVINRNLLTGLASIDLVNSTDASRPLRGIPKSIMRQNLLTAEDYPIIPEGKLGIETVVHSLPSVLENANGMVQDIRILVSPQNREAVSNILASWETISENLANGSKRTEEVADALLHLIRNLDGKAEKFESKTTELVTSVRTTAEAVGIVASRISMDLILAARTVSATVERFSDPKALLFGPAATQLGPGEDKPASADVKRLEGATR